MNVRRHRHSGPRFVPVKIPRNHIAGSFLFCDQLSVFDYRNRRIICRIRHGLLARRIRWEERDRKRRRKGFYQRKALLLKFN